MDTELLAKANGKTIRTARFTTWHGKEDRDSIKLTFTDDTEMDMFVDQDDPHLHFGFVTHLTVMKGG